MGSEFDASKELEAKVHREAHAIMMRLGDAIAAIVKGILDDYGIFTGQSPYATYLNDEGRELVKACFPPKDKKGNYQKFKPTNELLKLVMGRMI